MTNIRVSPSSVENGLPVCCSGVLIRKKAAFLRPLGDSYSVQIHPVECVQSHILPLVGKFVGKFYVSKLESFKIIYNFVI